MAFNLKSKCQFWIKNWVTSIKYLLKLLFSSFFVSFVSLENDYYEFYWLFLWHFFRLFLLHSCEEKSAMTMYIFRHFYCVFLYYFCIIRLRSVDLMKAKEKKNIRTSVLNCVMLRLYWVLFLSRNSDIFHFFAVFFPRCT